MGLDAIKEQLQKLEQEKLEMFNKELQVLCDKYNVTLNVQSQIIIVPKQNSV